MRHPRVLAAIAATFLVASAPAAAHEGNPNFQSVVNDVQPGTDGLRIEVVNFDDSFQLMNDSDEDVVVDGYEGEPYLRVDADGTVALNRNSTAYYLNDTRFGEGEVPDDVDPDGPPDWEVVDQSGTFSWHDHRMHWMSTALPPQVEDKSVETKIFDYEVPISVGGERGAIEGTLTWVGEDSSFPIAPFAGLGAVVLLAAALIAVRRRRTGAERDEAW